MRILTMQERIELGQAKNQAVEILKLYINKNPMETEDKYGSFYKKWITRFWEWNKEIERELLEKEYAKKIPVYTDKKEHSIDLSYPEHPQGKYGERR